MVLGIQLRQNEKASCVDMSNRIRKRTQTVLYHTSAKGRYGQTHVIEIGRAREWLVSSQCRIKRTSAPCATCVQMRSAVHTGRP
jgi:hypothetical protein